MFIYLQTCFNKFHTGSKTFISESGNKKMAEKEKDKTFMIFWCWNWLHMAKTNRIYIQAQEHVQNNSGETKAKKFPSCHRNKHLRPLCHRNKHLRVNFFYFQV
jgi:hypothetical protein